jgi:CheY-like chemotaxis protein
MGTVYAFVTVLPGMPGDGKSTGTMTTGDTVLKKHDRDDAFRVLIVDDEKHFCFSASLALRQSGLDVKAAANGQEALEILVASREAGKNYDMVITDIVMPVMDGIELIDNMKKQNLEIPTLVITGFLDTEYREALQVRGVTNTLEKPFMPDLLIDMVKNIIHSKSDFNCSSLTA